LSSNTNQKIIIIYLVKLPWYKKETKNKKTREITASCCEDC